MGAQATLGKLTVEDTVTGYLLYSNPVTTPRECEFEEPLESRAIETTGLFITVPSDVEAGLFIKQSHKMNILVRSTRSNMR